MRDSMLDGRCAWMLECADSDAMHNVWILLARATLQCNVD
jgi:hypothetical protein